MGLLKNTRVRFIAGQLVTCMMLAAGHWFPWWEPLGKLGAYTYGCTAIALGQGIYYKFDRRWLRIVSFVVTAGAVVFGAHGYDALAKRAALRRAGVRDIGAQ